MIGPVLFHLPRDLNRLVSLTRIEQIEALLGLRRELQAPGPCRCRKEGSREQHSAAQWEGHGRDLHANIVAQPPLRYKCREYTCREYTGRMGLPDLRSPRPL